MSYICGMGLIIGLILFTGFTFGIAMLIQRFAKRTLKGMEANEAKKLNEARINSNHYIQYHKFKEADGNKYQEYLDHLDITGHGIPVQQIKFREDELAKEKIKGLF